MIHPQFAALYGQVAFDLAMIELNEAIDYHQRPSVHPVCFPSKGLRSYEEVQEICNIELCECFYSFFRCLLWVGETLVSKKVQPNRTRLVWYKFLMVYIRHNNGLSTLQNRSQNQMLKAAFKNTFLLEKHLFKYFSLTLGSSMAPSRRVKI